MGDEWPFLKKLKIYFPYDPAISLLGIFTKKLKTGAQTDIVNQCS